LAFNANRLLDIALILYFNLFAFVREFWHNICNFVTKLL